MPKLRNILIFVAIGVVLVLVYFFVIKKPAATAPLVSSPTVPGVPGAAAATPKNNSAVAQEFLTLLLSVKNIRLDDAIFSEPAFASLDGSHSITLTPDGTEGRPNPFAPLGNDIVLSEESTLPLTPGGPAGAPLTP